MTTTSALELVGVSQSFGGFKVLKDITLSVPKSQIYGLIGPNGAGKSTLINVLSGRYNNTTGSIKLFDEEISGKSIGARRNAGLSRSFQHSSIFPHLTVRQQVALAAKAHSEGALEEVLNETGLEAYLDVISGTLAYGVQRRIDLAIALVGRPAVILLDEPMAGLTSQESRDLARHLQRLRDKLSVTILIVEHDMDIVFSICDSVSVLNFGEHILAGPPEEIRRSEEITRIYFGSEGA